MVVQNEMKNEAKQKKIGVPFLAHVTKLPNCSQLGPLNPCLFEWVDELQTEEAHIASHVLPQHAS